jgi:histidine ammonia-lyase
MAPRDGLAAIGVNAMSLASAAGAVRSAAGAVRTLMAVSVLGSGALGASPDPWKAATYVGTDVEALVGTWLCGSARQWVWQSGTHVHDPLSLRMMPQIFGTCFDSLLVAGRTLLAATGRTDDNPVVVDGEVLSSGGSLPLGVTVFLQAASIALAHVARNSFNRCVLLVNGGRRGLPVNLVPADTIATGFGPAVKAAAELFSRTLSLSSPVSAQSVVLAGGIEDEAAFLPLAVERFEAQVEAIRRLAALEAMLAAQAVDLLEDSPGGVARLIFEAVRSRAGFYVADRPLSCEIENIDGRLAANSFLAEVLGEAPLQTVDEFFSLNPD